jgi:amino-acid N-acetyltransferase
VGEIIALSPHASSPLQDKKQIFVYVKRTPAMINVRKAQLTDVPLMMPLLNEYAKQAEILPRMEADVYQSIRDWVIAETDGKIVGMGSLLIMWGDLAEIRSLVIDPACQGQGVGRAIVTQLLTEARMLGLPRVFALTRKPGFFLKMDFQLTRIEKLPRKVQKDCVFCPKFQACDEVAVIMPLNDEAAERVLDLAEIKRNVNGHQPIIPLINTSHR